MGLFAISRELSFRICNYGKPGASSLKAREAEWLLGRKKEVGGGEKKGSWGRGGSGVNRESGLFIGWVFFPLVAGVRAPRSGLLELLNWSFCVLALFSKPRMYISTTWEQPSLWDVTTKGGGSPVSQSLGRSGTKFPSEHLTQPPLIKVPSLLSPVFPYTFPPAQCFKILSSFVSWKLCSISLPSCDNFG